MLFSAEFVFIESRLALTTVFGCFKSLNTGLSDLKTVRLSDATLNRRIGGR
jgi:hypothetical protein